MVHRWHSGLSTGLHPHAGSGMQAPQSYQRSFQRTGRTGPLRQANTYVTFRQLFECPQESRLLCNLRMCFFAFLSGGHGPRSSLASASVQLFMQKMYYSISESMPTGLLGQQQKVFLGSCSSSCVPASWQTEKPCHWSASLLTATLESVCQPAGKQKSHVTSEVCQLFSSQS